MPEDDAPVGQPDATPPVDSELEKLRRKNAELLEEKRRLKQQLPPDGVDVQALLQFKQEHEQRKLESAGEYEKAKAALQEQYNNDIGSRDRRIAELEARVRELELISPATNELAKVVRPELLDDLFKAGRLRPEMIEKDANGPVVVNGLERIPVADWARQNLPTPYLREPAARGSGAPVGGGVVNQVEANDQDLQYFLPGTMNVTEQARIYKVNPERYEALKAAAKAAAARR